ncbi:hypothetical protein [Saccharopolyspora shandongensis]|uniref:hypothetical protein n=1 Tax=Saccharopolyspora shandongensis TaxID=418495 RepID=UPI0033F03637
MTEDGKPVADDDRQQWGGGNPPGNPEQPAQPESPESAGRGRIRYQDENTTPREPTLAEQRARIAAEKRREEQHSAELAAAEAKTKRRRRIMIGGGATVGVVALVAAMYSASEISNEANASVETCSKEVNGQIVVQEPQFCDENYVNTHGGYHSGGMFFMPLFIGGPPVPQYRYAYTEPGTRPPAPGQTMSGGSFTKPSGSTIKDSSGKTIQRGGFGINNKSGSSGS